MATWRSKLINPTIYDYHENYQDYLLEEMKFKFLDDEEDEIKKRLLDKKNRGQKIFKNIVKTLTDTDNIHLLPYQIKFVEECINSSVAKIYGSEWEKNKKKILEKHGIKEFHPEVFWTSGRRMGKTLSLSMLVCTLAMCVPSDCVHPLKIAVFSINRDASYRFIDECNSALRCLKGLGNFIIEKTKGRIRFINIENPDDVREIEGFCGKGNVSILFHLVLLMITTTITIINTNFFIGNFNKLFVFFYLII